MKDIFENIIKQKKWPGKGTVCGRGSTEESTKGLRNNLVEFLKKYNIQSMFDVPCGDYTWMSRINFPDNFKYIGGDIVNSLIEDNQVKYPGVEFVTFDLTTDTIPDVDVLFCRACLIHLTNDDIKKVIDNINKSKVKYILTTTYPNISNNRDIMVGDFRPINLSATPFNLPKPIDYIDDSSQHDNMVMSLWTKDQFYYTE